MQQYFVPADNWQGHTVIINDSDAHHITKVMRMTVDDRILCAHPYGDVAEATITSVDDNRVVSQIVAWLDQKVELPAKVTIAQGLPKGDKLESVLQKGTELGTHTFIPFKAARTIVKWDDKKTERRLLRYKKIIKEAAEQSHRAYLPEVQSPLDLDRLVESAADYDVCIYAYEEAARADKPYSALAQTLQFLKPGMQILVCIGPEGGFSPEEASALSDSGFIPVRCGPRILRTETAALYVLSAISYQLEELRCLE